MRRIPSLLALTLVFALACGGTPRGGAGGGSMPAAVGTYPALRFVPADASYVIAGRHATDVSAVLRELAGALGIVIDADVDDIAAGFRREMGYDPFDPASLQTLGIDTDGSAAFFSTGLSVTAVARLGDPAKLEAFIDNLRGKGVSMQSQLSGGVEVYSLHFDRDVQFSWAVVDGWILSRAELTAEHQPELAWFERAHAAHGAIAGEADFTAALAAARAHAASISADGGPPVIGLVRPPKIADALVEVVGDPAVEACLGAPLRDASRAMLAAGSGESAASGSLVVDFVDAARLAGNVVPTRGGWVAVEQGAPLQLDVGLDLAGYAKTLQGCPGAARELPMGGVRTAHIALHAFDEGLPSRAAFYADLSTDAFLRAQLKEIPGLGTFSRKGKLAGQDVVHVSVPFLIDLTYHLSAHLAAAQIGEHLLDLVLAPAEHDVPGVVFRLALRPHDIPVETWDMGLEYLLEMGAEARQRTIARVRRWQSVDIAATLDGARLVLTASGTRRR